MTKNRVFSYIYSRCGNRQDALDLTQEVFVATWKALPRFKYKSIGQFYGFIFLIARRQLAKYYRGQKSQVEFLDQTVDHSLPDNNLFGDADYLSVKKALKKLKFKHQEVVRLRYWSELSFFEISEVLNIKENTAKVWHFRAIKKLQKILNSNENNR